MKKYFIIFIIGVIIISIIFYLIRGNMSKVKISNENIINSNNIHLEYRVIEMRNYNYYIFNINEDVQKFDVLSYDDKVISSNTLDNDDVVALKNILVECNVNKWDGFDAADKNVLDGKMFTFNLKVDDVTIYASGSNAFPKYYKEFNDKLNQIIKKYDIIE